MTEAEKIDFLSERIKDLHRITSEIEEEFPEKSFKRLLLTDPIIHKELCL